MKESEAPETAAVEEDGQSAMVARSPADSVQHLVAYLAADIERRQAALDGAAAKLGAVKALHAEARDLLAELRAGEEGVA